MLPATGLEAVGEGARCPLQAKAGLELVSRASSEPSASSLPLGPFS